MTALQRPVRVLHLRDSPWVDGPGRTILETASHIDRRRVDYQVGLFVHPGARHPLAESLRARGLPVHELRDDGSSIRAVADHVHALLRDRDIEVLHSSELRSNLVGWLCRRRRRMRIVATAHGWIANDVRGMLRAGVDRALLARFDRVQFVSNATRRRVPRWWLPDNRAVVLRNALVLDRHPWINERGRSGQSGVDRVVNMLCAGRLSAEKGQSVLIRALAQLAPAYPGLALSFAGTGPEEDRLRNLADQLHVSNRITFHGYVADMRPLYARASVVVQCSSTEGLPNVILEAAAVGVPIVATDVGGTSEVITHGVSGWLVRPTLGGLMDGIRRFLENPEQFEAMTRAARARIEGEFSFDLRTERQTRIYEELAGRCGGRSH